MAVKKQLTVSLTNKVGELARLCNVLKRAKVNILAISVVDTADTSIVRLVADNAAKAKAALTAAKMPVTVRDVLLLYLPDRVGELAALAGKLAKAKINIEYVYATACSCKECTDVGVVIAADNMAKAAINHLGRTMAAELAPYRINVNMVNPGWIDTPGERRFATEEQLREGGKRIPWGRLGTPEDVGKAVAFLVSDDADYITGATLRVDGGFLLGLGLPPPAQE